MNGWTRYKSVESKGWFGNIFRRTPKPEQPHQDMRGKPCPPGYNTARDHCISDDGHSENKKPKVDTSSHDGTVSENPKPNSDVTQKVDKPSKEPTTKKYDYRSSVPFPKEFQPTLDAEQIKSMIMGKDGLLLLPTVGDGLLALNIAMTLRNNGEAVPKSINAVDMVSVATPRQKKLYCRI